MTTSRAKRNGIKECTRNGGPRFDLAARRMLSGSQEPPQYGCQFVTYPVRK